MPTNDELRAMVEQLEDNHFVRASFDDNPTRYYPTTLPAEAAALLRSILAEREQKVISRQERESYIHKYEQEYGKGSFSQRGYK